ncbi:MAG: carboxypeptidase regulatory-like domain-containing protein [Candidatus Omnitrophica bacterium]|nr:carboxypeptidase regulatory-like domain-containing protein [Candidatus Omnitrophota bacterium]
MRSKKLYASLSRSVVISVFFTVSAYFFMSPQAMGAIGHMGITGAVYNAETLEGVSGAIVKVRSEGFSETVPTDANGSYSVSSCPTDYEITISCRKAGFRPYAVVIPSISSETTIANYVHNIYLRTLTGEEPTYDEDDAGVIYIIGDDSQNSLERDYTPGVEPGDFGEREEGGTFQE